MCCCCVHQHICSRLIPSVVCVLMHADTKLDALYTAMVLMQGLHPTAKAKRRSNRISQNDEVPAAQPPAGPIEDEVSLSASAFDACDAASDPPSETPAAAATTAASTAATTAADDTAPPASSAPVASPQLSEKTSSQSHQSPSMSHHEGAVQDTMQSAELSGTLALLQCSQGLSAHLAKNVCSDKTAVPVLAMCLSAAESDACPYFIET